jgi:hypothetical protein
MGLGCCQFCNEEEAEPHRLVKFPMYKITEQGVSNVRYVPNKLFLPRCKRCAQAHAPQWHWAGWAALLGAIFGAIIGPAAAAAGASAFLFLAGSFMLFAAAKSDLGQLGGFVMLLGIGVFICGFTCFPDAYKDENSGIVPFQMAGGALAFAEIAFAITWFKRKEVEGQLTKHKDYLALISQGFESGEKPPGYS